MKNKKEINPKVYKPEDIAKMIDRSLPIARDEIKKAQEYQLELFPKSRTVKGRISKLFWDKFYFNNEDLMK